jgi:hypothetical protein
MSNCRRYARRSCAELINVCTATGKDRVGLARDLSATEMRFDSTSRFSVGEGVDILIQAASVGRRYATGRIVRTSSTPNYVSLYPHVAVVEFDVPCFDLIEPTSADQVETAPDRRISALDIAKLI